MEGVGLLLENEQAYAEMTSQNNPFGDGHASQKIIDIICR